MSDDILFFDFYGILVKVLINDKESSKFIGTDFSYFRVDIAEGTRAPDITLSVYLRTPPHKKIPEGTLAAYHTKDAVVYKQGKVTYYDYSGEALVVYDDRHHSAEIYSLDRNFLYEKSYLMVMSRVGLELDRKKLHRIHAMGVVFEGRTILCLLPMGGGKTTLTLSLLEKKAFSLLSEEIPLVSSKGRLYPMPIRMGVTAGTSLSIPEKFLKPFQRRHYKPKVLIDINYFNDQIAPVSEPGFVFVGKRIHSSKPKIIKISRLKAFVPLFRLCVMGMGFPQLLEYVLRFDLLNMVGRISIFLSRLSASLALLRHSETYELHLSYNRSANADFVSEFVSQKHREHGGGGKHE
jgi:hypothetical protein